MDIYTKLFLANLLSLILVAAIDKHLLNDQLEKLPIIGVVLGLWAALTLISIPVYVVYLLVTL